ncbi:MAG: phosphoribosylglycinamide formyltransferase [Bacteroidetes bacterium]|nr:phosphoribosylglycinamide formyltransferase [Bacteroidota bacterium]HNR18850.1 phosphoribosylglycinamide formyltransferase [Bacteroidia bacterium]HNU32430.1 phosphoribosylglycinamide formyltransferase [Bacteroidia bacterium]
MSLHTQLQTYSVAIFASGSGTNAENICNYFKHHTFIKVCLIVTNNPHAGVIKRAEKLEVPLEVISKEIYNDVEKLTSLLKKYKTDFVVLAGYLKLIPAGLVEAFPARIINIHPALLPKHGGKGMFGMHVHEEVKKAAEDKTGITIHYINGRFDEGEIIFQAETNVEVDDTPFVIAEKVHKLEYEYFPKVIEEVILKYQRNV